MEEPYVGYTVPTVVDGVCLCQKVSFGYDINFCLAIRLSVSSFLLVSQSVC